MQELLAKNAWLIPSVLGLMIPITAIVCGTVTQYLRKTRQAELDAGLKQEMIQRGMSAEEIKLVLEASSRAAPRKRSCSHV